MRPSVHREPGGPGARDYPCEFCDTGKPQEKRLVTLTRRYKGKVYVFENVPAQVCPNCGHRYFDGPLMLKLEQLMEDTPADARPVEAYAITLPLAG
jgi:YgiT-type zinc finger domain-containing protein